MFVIIFLVGKLFLNDRFISFLKLNNKFEWYEYFWAGLAGVFAISQIWSIFLPVNIFSLGFIVFLSLVSAALLFKQGFKPHKLKINPLFIISSIIVLFVISYFSSLSVGWPDTLGYHLGAVKWINTYKVVPGLANLYTPLGLNSSFFTFASLVGNSFLRERVSHIALSLIASVLSIEYLWVFFKSKNTYLKTFILLSLPIFIEGIVHTAQVSSLSYDFALLIIILAICVELIKGKLTSFFIVVILSAMLATIKLTGMVFAFAVFIFSAYKFFKNRSKSVNILYGCILIGVVFITPYIVRNIILSGWPLYPLPLLRLNVSWAVPYEIVHEVYVINKAWAILPGIHFPEAIGLSFIEWFPGWFLRNVHAIELKVFFATFVLLIGAIFSRRIFNRKAIKKNIGLVVCMATSLIGILFFVISAPDFRFGSVYFWVFFASVGSSFFVGITSKYPKLSAIFMVLSILLAIFAYWPPRIDSEIMLKSIRWDQSMSKGVYLIRPKDGSNPFYVYTTKEDGNCGNSELPCTSVVSDNIKEIVPGDISKGFAPVK